MNQWTSRLITFLPPRPFRKGPLDDFPQDKLHYSGKRPQNRTTSGRTYLPTDRPGNSFLSVSDGEYSAIELLRELEVRLPDSKREAGRFMQTPKNKLHELLLLDDQPDVQLGALSVLADVSSRRSLAPVDALVPSLLRLLESDHDRIVARSLCSLANMVADRPALPAIQLILHSLSETISPSNSRTVVELASRCLANICRLECAAKVLKPLVGLLEQVLLETTNGRTVPDVWWAFIFLSSNRSNVVSLGEASVANLVELLQEAEENQDFLHLLLEVLINVVTLSEDATRTFIGVGGLRALKGILEKDWVFNCYAAYALSNICAESSGTIQKVLDCGLLPSVMLCLKGGKFRIRSETAWVVGNIACKGSDDHILLLEAQDAVKILIELMAFNDVHLIIISLTVIEEIVILLKKHQRTEKFCKDIEDCNFLGILDNLKYHDNEEVVLTASRLRLHLRKVKSFDGKHADPLIERLCINSPQGDGPVF